MENQILDITLYGHPVLRQLGAREEAFGPEFQVLVDQMLRTMFQNKGVGLAAQQIGQALQLCVIDLQLPKDGPNAEGSDQDLDGGVCELDGQTIGVASLMPLVIVNPDLSFTGDSEWSMEEGCLSFPELGQFAVWRPEYIALNYQDRNGVPHQLKTGGYLGRVIQHEVDHLFGKLFISRMEGKVRKAAQEKLLLLKPRYAKAQFWKSGLDKDL